MVVWQDWWSQLVYVSLGQLPPVGTWEGTWNRDSTSITGCGVLLQLGEAMSRGAQQADGTSSVCRMHQCWIVLSFPPTARSRAAGGHIPCPLLTEILIYAIRSIKNKEFWHSSSFACTLQWVSANSSAAVYSAQNPGERLLSWGISSDLIAKL